MNHPALPRAFDPEIPLPLANQASQPMGALLVELGRLSAQDADRIHARQQITGQL
jgi:hypothetical protein